MPHTRSHTDGLAQRCLAAVSERTIGNRRNGFNICWCNTDSERQLCQGAVLKITSLQNQKVKDVVRLRDRKARDETGLFLIEGYRELKRALDAGRKMTTVFFCPEFFLGSNE